MKFTFSPNFRHSQYCQLLRDLGAEIDTYRLISGTNVRELMSALHISHSILKKH